MRLTTIGFTKTTAERFFTRLRDARVRTIIDVRLHNVSQLAGFAKRDDLRYFARTIVDADYVHLPSLAPTEPMLAAYRAPDGSWDRFAESFVRLLAERRVEESIPRELLADGCLLCSEDRAHRCHRRLVAEYLQSRWGSVVIEHL